MSDSEEIVVTKKGTPNNKKRKFNDADLQSPQGKKSKTSLTPTVLTPVVGSAQKNKKLKGLTPKQNPEVVEKSKSKKRKHVDENGSDNDAVETEDIKPQKKAGKSALKKNKGADADSTEKTNVPAAAKDADRKDNRDSRTLFVKNLPLNCSVKQIKALSKDVKQVRIRTTFSVVDKKRLRILYAYVEFANEELAEKNMKILGESYVKGNKLVVDYVGTKSSFITNKLKTEPEEVDELRLYVTGLPENATENDLRKLFPKATDIVLPKRKKDKKVFGYGFITFNSTELAKKAHTTGQDLSLGDCKLVVLYAKKRKVQSDKDKRKKEEKEANSEAKGTVTDKKNGESPDAEDDDDDEEEEDDEEEDDDDEEEEDDDDEEEDDE